MKVDETGWLESRRDADASEGDTEGWCEVSDETMLLGSEEEHRVEHVVGFETDCSETHTEVWAEVHEEVRTAESEGDTEGWDEVMNEACWLDSEEESVRMSVGDVGM